MVKDYFNEYVNLYKLVKAYRPDLLNADLFDLSRGQKLDGSYIIGTYGQENGKDIIITKDDDAYEIKTGTNRLCIGMCDSVSSPIFEEDMVSIVLPEGDIITGTVVDFHHEWAIKTEDGGYHLIPDLILQGVTEENFNILDRFSDKEKDDCEYETKWKVDEAKIVFNSAESFDFFPSDYTFSYEVSKEESDILMDEFQYSKDNVDTDAYVENMEICFTPYNDVFAVSGVCTDSAGYTHFINLNSQFKDPSVFWDKIPKDLEPDNEYEL